MSRTRGVSLAEVLVVLAVMAVLATLALPWMAGWVDGSRREAILHAFMTDLALTRSEAIRRGQMIAMCPSVDGTACDAQAEWVQGRLLFEDANGNGIRDATERVIRFSEASAAGWALVGNTPVRRYVAYHPSGRTRQVGGALQMGTFSLCKAAAGGGRQIVISASGRPRIQKANASVCP